MALNQRAVDKFAIFATPSRSEYAADASASGCGPNSDNGKDDGAVVVIDGVGGSELDDVVGGKPEVVLDEAVVAVTVLAFDESKG